MSCCFGDKSRWLRVSVMMFFLLSNVPLWDQIPQATFTIQLDLQMPTFYVKGSGGPYVLIFDPEVCFFKWLRVSTPVEYLLWAWLNFQGRIILHNDSTKLCVTNISIDMKYHTKLRICEDGLLLNDFWIYHFCSTSVHVHLTACETSTDNWISIWLWHFHISW